MAEKKIQLDKLVDAQAKGKTVKAVETDQETGEGGDLDVRTSKSASRFQLEID